MKKTQEVHGCAERVAAHTGYYSHPCASKGVVYEEGKWWCRRHSPSAVAARQAIAKQRWNARIERQAEMWKPDHVWLVSAFGTPLAVHSNQDKALKAALRKAGGTVTKFKLN